VKGEGLRDKVKEVTPTTEMSGSVIIRLGLHHRLGVPESSPRPYPRPTTGRVPAAFFFGLRSK
jgi:hypothetical protein